MIKNYSQKSALYYGTRYHRRHDKIHDQGWLSIQTFLDSDKVLYSWYFYPIGVILFVQRKFFLASETAQRHVTEIVGRDAKEMGGLIEAANTMGVGIRTLANDYYPSFVKGLYRYMGRLSRWWSIFDQEVFLVSFTSVPMPITRMFLVWWKSQQKLRIRSLMWFTSVNYCNHEKWVHNPLFNLSVCASGRGGLPNSPGTDI